VLQPQVPMQDTLQVFQQQEPVQVLLAQGSQELNDGFSYGSSTAPISLLLQQLYL
jgi:hypothetical protein